MCDEIPPVGQNDLYWCDDRLDAAERGALSTYDRSVRKRYYAITQDELASQSVTIFLYFARQVFVTSPDLRGFVPAPATSSNWNTWEWSI
jgi:ABC-type transport system substrate-binding protein